MLTPVFKVSERLDGTVDETACATAAKATMTLSSQRVLLGQACRPTFVDGGRMASGTPRPQHLAWFARETGKPNRCSED